MSKYFYTRLLQLIKKQNAVTQIGLLGYVLSLHASNLIGMGFSQVLASIPYPFIDRRSPPEFIGYYIDERRSQFGRITPRLALTTSYGLMLITISSFAFAVLLHPAWVYVPLAFAIYTVLVMVSRQLRIVLLGRE